MMYSGPKSLDYRSDYLYPEKECKPCAYEDFLNAERAMSQRI